MQKEIQNIFFVSVKLSVLRREYLSLAVNLLTMILKTLYITKRDFLQLNCLHREK